MARTLATLPAGSRITDYIPLDKIRAALAATGKESVRRRDLPAHVVVYYVIALALYIALVVSGSATLSAGRNPVAGGALGGNQCGGQFRRLAGANQAGMGDDNRGANPIGKLRHDNNSGRL
jgi:Insertion element 4 transposase N-terminal